MTNLEGYIYFIRAFLPRVSGDKMKIGKRKLRTILCFCVIAMRHINNILFNVLLYHKPRAATQSQSFTLTDSVKPISPVSSDPFPCLPLDHRSFFLSKKTADKIIVVYLTQEANALAVFSTRIRKFRILCYLAHFMFHQMTDRKHQFGNLKIINLSKKISLIFHGIFGCTKPNLPIPQ